MADDLNMNVNIDTADSQTNLADAVESVGGLDQALTDAQTSADTAADGVSDAAGRMTDALGSVDGSGLGDAAGAADDVTGSLDGAAESAGGVDAAIGGMAGKAIVSLPGVGEAMGPMTKGLQQVIKGALSGGQNLAKMAATAGAMILVSVALKQIADESAKAAEIKAFRKEEVEDFTKSILKGGNAVSDLTDKLTKAGKIEVIAPFGDKTDITSTLAKYGISVEQFAAAVTGGQPALDAFHHALDAAGVSSGDSAKILGGAIDASDQYSKAQQAAAAFTSVFGDKAGDAAKHTADLKFETEQAKEAAEQIKTAIENETTAYKNQADEIGKTLAQTKALANANHAAADANYAVQDATDTYLDSVDGLDAKITEAEGNQRKINAAYRDATQNASALAQAQVDLADKQATANGETLSAAQKQDILNQSMLTSAATATGPLRDSILAYITQANGIPTDIATKISAAVAAGDLDKANALLADASKDRATSVQVDVDQAALDAVNKKLDDVARTRNVKYDATGGMIGGKAYASGTDNYRPGLGDTFAENGPEAAITDGGGRVRILTNGATNRMLNDLGGTHIDASTHIYNFPPGVSPETFASAKLETDRRRLS